MPFEGVVVNQGEPSIPSTRLGTREVWIFIVATFLASAVFDYPLFGPRPLSEQPGLFDWLVMWCPGFVAIGFVLARQSTLRDLGLVRLGGSNLAWGLLLPLAFTAPFYLLASGLGYCRLVPSGLSGHVISVLLILPGSFGRALGEEIGWRGFLFPQLRKRFSFAHASLTTGAVWALWHFAVIIQGAYLDASHVPLGAGLLLFTVSMVGQTFVYTWLRERSGSVWPAACVHASYNWFTQRVMTEHVLKATPQTSLAVGEMSIGFAAMGILLALLLWKRFDKEMSRDGLDLNPKWVAGDQSSGL